MALFQNRNVIGDSFWKVLKSPELFREEIDSYKTEDLELGYIDIPMMVAGISILVRQGAFWKAIVEILKQYSTPTMSWKEMEEFAKFMKDDYIAELDGEAKEHCIEISKFLKRVKLHKTDSVIELQ